MKVHNKGQVVIPAHVRRELGIEIGDMLEVEVLPEEGRIELRRRTEQAARALAGSLSRYAGDKPFPSRDQIQDALRRGLSDRG